MHSGLFTSKADALISYVIDKLDPAERIKPWLKQDLARIVFQKALTRAYSAFVCQYPEYTSYLFDQSFLSKETFPELSKLSTRDQPLSLHCPPKHGDSPSAKIRTLLKQPLIPHHTLSNA